VAAEEETGSTADQHDGGGLIEGRDYEVDVETLDSANADDLDPEPALV
jgi:hypothetical protein